jgi:hypothetical protein
MFIENGSTKNKFIKSHTHEKVKKTTLNDVSSLHRRVHISRVLDHNIDHHASAWQLATDEEQLSTSKLEKTMQSISGSSRTWNSPASNALSLRRTFFSITASK